MRAPRQLISFSFAGFLLGSCWERRLILPLAHRGRKPWWILCGDGNLVRTSGDAVFPRAHTTNYRRLNPPVKWPIQLPLEKPRPGRELAALASVATRQSRTPVFFRTATAGWFSEQPSLLRAFRVIYRLTGYPRRYLSKRQGPGNPGGKIWGQSGACVAGSPGPQGGSGVATQPRSARRGACSLKLLDTEIP